MTELAVRPMTLSELAVACDWAAAEGWNPGLHDAPAFHAADADGFLMGFLDNEPVVAISVVAYGDAFGFLGFYICRPENRGQGHGWKIWQAGMARLGNRTVGLDGVVAQQENYARSGFSLVRRNVRYGGVAAGNRPADTRVLDVGNIANLVDPIVSYDRAFFPGPRERFIRAWLTLPGRRTFAWAEEGAIRGYGCVRECRSGFKIGPLFADNEEIAEALLVALAASVSGAEIFLDVPQPNAAAVSLAERHGFAPVFETARMYRGPAPAEPIERIFGITTFELG